MDLNTIRLSQYAISSLYKNAIVENNDAGHVREMEKAAGKPEYLGANKKRILLVVSYADYLHLPDEQLSFLTNLLTPCKLSMADVAVLNTESNAGIDHKTLLKFFHPKIMILFGDQLEGMDMPFHFPHFQVQPFDGIIYLSSPALHEIENDKVAKSKLWVCLKKIFNI